MSAPEIGLAADAEALNLADEVRRILADGQPRTTRQVAAMSRLTNGGDDVSKTIYLLRMRGEIVTDVVDSARLHRMIPGGGPGERQPAPPRPRPSRRANIAQRSCAPTEDSAAAREDADLPNPAPGATAPPRLTLINGALAGRAGEGDAPLQIAIDDTGAVALLRDNDTMIELSQADTRRLAEFLARTMAVWSPDPQATP